MAYTIDEQETHIWYDPKTKETIVETNYVHDINHYLHKGTEKARGFNPGMNRADNIFKYTYSK